MINNPEDYYQKLREFLHSQPMEMRKEWYEARKRLRAEGKYKKSSGPMSEDLKRYFDLTLDYYAAADRLSREEDEFWERQEQ